MFRVLALCVLLSMVMNNAMARKDKINQLELQENVQRFYTRFTERVLEGLLDTKVGKDPKYREIVLNQYLLYDSEGLKIATGPYPEVNLLDMIIFIKLNRLLVEHYWIPQVWKGDGSKLRRAFADSERDIDEVASSVVSRKSIQDINKGLLYWRKQYPDQIRVEKIRLAEVAGLAEKAKEKQTKQSRGGLFSIFGNLLVDTRGAVQAVDQAVLVVNRALFLAQYMPSILRLQTRLASNEIVDDVTLKLSQMGHVSKNLNQMNGALTSVSSIMRDLDLFAKDLRQILVTYKKEFPGGVNTTGNLQEIHGIVDKSNELMKEVKGFKGIDYSVQEGIKKFAINSVFLITCLMIFVGMIVSVFFWSCYYFVKKKLLKQAPVL